MGLIKQKTLVNILIIILTNFMIGYAVTSSNMPLFDDTINHNSLVIIPIDTLHHLKGNWEGQKSTYSCWRASLANLTKICWEDSLRRKEEKDIDPTNQKDEVIDLMHFDSLTNKKYVFTHHNSVKGDSVLTFHAINQYLRYNYPRPLIHSFSYKDGDEETNHRDRKSVV